MNGGRMTPVSEVEVSTVSGKGGNGRAGQLSRDDCVCTVCLEIFLEPVTLPCDHTFCKPCFLDTVDKSNMCCPLCRKRVSTWARKNSRNQTLVNDELWRRVQAAFPMQCQRRLLGLEDGEEEEGLVPSPRVCRPGELRREYEDQISKLAAEKRDLEEAERRASEEYIQRLLAEEEEPLAEERRRQEERQMEDDERLARLLSEELNSTPISDSQRNTRTNEVTPAKKKPKANAGDIEKFLCPVPPKHGSSESSSSFMANKENILHHPFSPLSPKEPTERPMPQLEYYGRQTCRPQSDTMTSSEPPAIHPALTSTTKPDQWPSPSCSKGDGIPSPSCSKRDGIPSPSCSKRDGMPSKSQMPSSTKRKCSEMEPNSEEVTFTKRPCTSSSSLPPHPGVAAAGGSEEVPLLLELTQWEEELFSQRRQEEEDRLLALRLQKELYKEELQKATDRSKGSANSYQFRQNPKPSDKAGDKDTASPGTSSSTSSGPERAVPSKPNKARSSPSSSSSSHKEEKDKAKRSPSCSATVGQKRSSTSTVSTVTKPLGKGSKQGIKQAILTEMFPSLAS